jgi:hypothetical protein
MNPTQLELEELRKGLRKRKLPQISAVMFGQLIGLGSFKVIGDDKELLSIEWQVTATGGRNEKRIYRFSDLSFSPDLEKERYELGMLMSKIFLEHGREIRNSIPGPNEAMKESNPYFVEADKWEHWAKVAPGFFLK